VGNVNQVERSARHEILKTGLSADITAQMLNQRVTFGLVEPDAVGHCSVHVDDHDVTPIRGCAVAALRPIDPKRGPQQVRQRCRRDLAVRVLADRAPQLQSLHQRLAAPHVRSRQFDDRRLLRRQLSATVRKHGC
jgi:hypothetical protein